MPIFDRNGRRLVIALLVSLVGNVVDAQEPRDAAKMSATQIREETERLRVEIAKLRGSQDAPAEWKELMKVEDAIAQKTADRDKAVENLQERADELKKTAAVSSLDATRSELVFRIHELSYYDGRHVREEGDKLFKTRHEELAKRARQSTPKLRGMGLDVLSYPRCDGSTSTQPLAALIACRCFDLSYEWRGKNAFKDALPPSIRRDRNGNYVFPLIDNRRTSNELELYFSFSEEPEAKLLEYYVAAKGAGFPQDRLSAIVNGLLARNASTHEAYVNVIEDRSDIGLLARRPSEEELNLAKEKNAELEIHPCALDAFVFIVDRENPFQNLTTQQIREIYSGRKDNWKEIGGSDRKITAYQREEESGSQQLMRSLVMKDVPLVVKTNSDPGGIDNQLIESLMGGVYLALSGNAYGIGYSVHYYERYMSGSARTRSIAVDGVEPTAETIACRKYPFVCEVFVVTRKNLPETSPTRKLRDWLLTPEGQAVVAESGYVPLAK